MFQLQNQASPLKFVLELLRPILLLLGNIVMSITIWLVLLPLQHLRSISMSLQSLWQLFEHTRSSRERLKRFQRLEHLINKMILSRNFKPNWKYWWQGKLLRQGNFRQMIYEDIVKNHYIQLVFNKFRRIQAAEDLINYPFITLH